MNKQLTIVCAILERGDTFLVTRRHDPEIPRWHQRWEIPGGKIDANESVEEALEREVFEETGLTFCSEQLLGVHTYHWQMPDHMQQTFILLYRCEAGDGEVVLRPDEHDAYRWVTLDDFYAMDDLLDGGKEMIKKLYR